MRQRTTFLQKPESPFAHNQAVFSTDARTLSIHDLDAAREERLTLGFEEVPFEIWQVLKQLHALRIRWASDRVYEAQSPFSSRVTPGLHVFVEPGSGGVGEGKVKGKGKGVAGDSVCTLLKKVFDDGLDCVGFETSFINPSIPSTTYQFYYSLLPSLENLATYIQQTICGGDGECHRRAESIRSADSVDLNYDSASHSLTVSGFWAGSPGGKGWSEVIRQGEREGRNKDKEKVEVGLLGAEGAADPVEIKMGGLLVDVGGDEEMKPTLFSFPSRHLPLPDDATYSVSFPAPTGMHPTMTISMPREKLTRPGPPDATCALHAYLTLPSTIFGDKYQLSTTDPLFLKSHNLVALRAVAGDTDLEAPDWFVSRWGSTWLLELATPSHEDETSNKGPEGRDGDGDGNWNVTIPLHLRYLRPSESGYRSASIPWPVVFWACTADQSAKMEMNPFDRVDLGWDRHFGPRTMFYQLHPSPNMGEGGVSWPLVEELEVPVLRLEEGQGFFQGRVIEFGTVAVIALGSLWVLSKLGSVVRSTGIRPQTRRDDKRGKSE